MSTHICQIYWNNCTKQFFSAPDSDGKSDDGRTDDR